jgi:hypothetical protein
MVLSAPTSAAEIKAMIPPPLQPSLDALIPKFEAASGHRLVITYEPSWLNIGCRVITLFPAEKLPIANRY